MCGGTSPTVTILIGATSNTPYPPAITDGTNISSTEEGDTDFTTGVTSGTNVIFKKTGAISAITAINYTGNTNLFSSGPTLQADGTWKGVIGNMQAGSIETYSISYMVDGNTYTQDPKIEINQ